MWVVKLGGSLLGSPELARWLEIFAKFSDGKVVIVPGGGLLADAVREAQHLSNTSDAVAHQLAVIAMDQFGLLLAGMNPDLAIARNELEIAERGWQHRGIVWLPSEMVLADDSIPRNWQVTSDSLSAWLASKLDAKQLILVKSKPIVKSKPVNADQKAASIPLQTLVEDEVIDSQFVNFATGQNYQTWVLNKADYSFFEQGFSLQKLKEIGQLVNTTAQ